MALYAPVPLLCDLSRSTSPSSALMPFPSPRSWHSSRSSGIESTQQEAEEAEEAESSRREWEEAAQMAELVAEACMAEEEERGVEARSSEGGWESPCRLRELRVGTSHARSSECSPYSRGSGASSCSSSSAASAHGSQGGSPTSVLGSTTAEAWDVLFAAVGKIQKIAAAQETLLAAGAGSGPVRGSSGAQQQRRQQGRRGRQEIGVSRMMMHGVQGGAAHYSKADSVNAAAPYPLAAPSAGSPPRVPPASGTGVFLPRRAPQPSASSSGGGSSAGGHSVSRREAAGKKAAPTPPPVYLPARLVQQFGLAVDGENNVVLNKQTQQQGSRKAGAAAPVIKLAVSSSQKSSSRPNCRRNSSQQKPQPQGSSREARTDSLNLPSEWQY